MRWVRISQKPKKWLKGTSFVLITALFFTTGCKKNEPKLTGKFQLEEEDVAVPQVWEFTEDGKIITTQFFTYSKIEEDGVKKLILEDGEDDRSGLNYVITGEKERYQLVEDIVEPEDKREHFQIKLASGEDGLSKDEYEFDGSYTRTENETTVFTFKKSGRATLSKEEYVYQLGENNEITVHNQEETCKFSYRFSKNGNKLVLTDTDNEVKFHRVSSEAVEKL